jgi:hypothetical protein
VKKIRSNADKVREVSLIIDKIEGQIEDMEGKRKEAHFDQMANLKRKLGLFKEVLKMYITTLKAL